MRNGYEKIRDTLRKYFTETLEAQKQSIRQNGHLSALSVAGFENAVQQAHVPTTTSMREHLQSAAVDDLMVNHILETLGIPTELSAETRRKFATEYRRADGAYAQAVLNYDRNFDRYHFDANPNAVSQPQPSPAATNDTSLAELVADFWKYSKLEKRWIGKTEGEKQEHVDLLYEALGRDKPAMSVGRADARRMRDILVAYPVNRNKLARTRGKTLGELSEMTGLRTLHPLTINKYLQTYNGLFNWAKLNGYCGDNPFSGLSLRTDKANDEAPRLPFPDTALDTVRAALLDPDRKTQDHHKWGTLIAMHSGARLNEVAQLHLDDITMSDEIWCFDINAAGATKKLKNSASKRVVPIHPRLIELGFLDYVQTMRVRNGNSRLFPQLSYTASDGYGRNLGRWFNETLLPDLGIKTKQLTFHSLRHTVVERLIAAEVTQEHIMAIVGHEPGTTTLKTYNRNGFPPKQLLSALEKVL